MKNVITGICLLGLSTTALVGCGPATYGTAAGAGVGAGVGYAVSGGSGLGTAVGLGAGALVGNTIGASLQDPYYYGYAWDGYYAPYTYYNPYYY